MYFFCMFYRAIYSVEISLHNGNTCEVVTFSLINMYSGRIALLYNIFEYLGYRYCHPWSYK